ncbi:MAG: 30S ribosomal protein S17 [Nanoarchaeota archaeon]|nr:30S ribosomal protein S17 [Nanoarchaeota archaeon]
MKTDTKKPKENTGNTQASVSEHKGLKTPSRGQRFLAEEGTGIKICKDRHCPFHGSLRFRGRMLEGTIIKTDPATTAKFVLKRMHHLKKYERYEKRITRLSVHNPPCISAKQGDKVKIAECRPISKTKKFVIIEVLK